MLVHEGYTGTYPLHNDIGLIRLARPAVINNNTNLVCLPLDEEEVIANFEGQLTDITLLEEVFGVVAGWGRTEFKSTDFKVGRCKEKVQR